ERLDRHEAAVVGEQAAGDRGERRRDHEGEQLVAGDGDAERLRHGLATADRVPGTAGAATHQVDAEEQGDRREREQHEVPEPAVGELMLREARRIDGDAAPKRWSDWV